MIAHTSHKQLPFWLVTIAVTAALTIPFLVRDGMFLDGILYSAVAQNLSRGIGSFWFPVFSHAQLVGYTTFHEHPPLGFAIQACFYRLVGHGLYAERLYIGLTLIITAMMIAGLWRRIYREDARIKAMAWLPILFWIIVPVCSWSYRNNMCEDTMTIFVLASVWILYDNMERAAPSFSGYILAGLFLFCASLIKGAPGLFPLAVPVLYAITIRRHTLLQIVYATSVLLLTVVIAYLVTLCFADARRGLSIYFFDRLLNRVRTGANVGSHFTLGLMLLGELIIPLAACFLVFLIYRFKRAVSPGPTKTGLILFFLLLGLSGSLPLMLTLMQRSYYFVTVFPYFAIAAASYIAPAMEVLIEYICGHIIFYRGLLVSAFTAIAVVIAICICTAGTAYRDKDTLHDIYAVGAHIPRNSIVAASDQLRLQFSVQTYMMRYFDISYDNPGDTVHYYFYVKGETPQDPRFHKLDWSLRTIDVYETDK